MPRGPSIRAGPARPVGKSVRASKEPEDRDEIDLKGHRNEPCAANATGRGYEKLSGGTRRRRLDVEMVRRGLASSREAARRLIGEGRVLARGAPVDKPARLVDPGDPIAIVGEEDYVSRAGAKLAAALESFCIDLTGLRCADLGAGTGGFTDCMLRAGAAEVVAVDVGHGTFHSRLRLDPRVRLFEKTDVRLVDRELSGGPVGFAAVDLSFITCLAAAEPVLRITERESSVVILVKPQFEVGPRDASRGKGVIRDPALWERVLLRVGGALEAKGGSVTGLVPSPVKGRSGNVEFLCHWRPHVGVGDPGRLGRLVRTALLRAAEE
ncbi:MAG: TlyA family rRNA (cytidine-2'-O)-methyltransferase [Acidimicrobiales bacterium]|nr:MAG: TlyA family rRNA (cytidine-2'-O)-methyltransferase [Acidimicrobiales bacterium]